MPQDSPTPAEPDPSETFGSSVMWTIGHSTRPIDEFLGLLRTYGIQLLADVRIMPYSRRHPQFHSDALAKSLTDAAIAYRHMPKLGGRRKSRPDSVNAGWRNASFRGYADYMETPPFQEALDDLMAAGQKLSVAIMCAEAVPWRCHRTLIADALVSRGWTVRHIISTTSFKPHTLTPFAKIAGDHLTYPSQAPGPESNPRLPLFS